MHSTTSSVSARPSAGADSGMGTGLVFLGLMLTAAVAVPSPFVEGEFDRTSAEGAASVSARV